MDRTLKWLLGAVVLLLAIIAFKPSVEVEPLAFAQNTVPPTIVTRQTTPQTPFLPEYLPDNLVSLGYQVPQPTVIAVPKGDYVREIQILDSAQAFLVRYDNRIEVYRVQRLTMDQETYAERLKRGNR